MHTVRLPCRRNEINNQNGSLLVGDCCISVPDVAGRQERLKPATDARDQLFGVPLPSRGRERRQSDHLTERGLWDISRQELVPSNWTRGPGGDVTAPAAEKRGDLV